MEKHILHKAIQSLISIAKVDLDYVVSFFHPLPLKKDEYFLQIGKKCEQVAFVAEGILRIYYPNDNGDETTCYFALPNEFVTSFTSFTSGTPSVENIQAIVPATIFVINKKDLDMLYNKIPVMQELGRKAAENLAIIMEKRISLFLNNTAEQRYAYLLKHNSTLIQKVPLQYLASYLGISPQHLSRLRRNIL